MFDGSKLGLVLFVEDMRVSAITNLNLSTLKSFRWVGVWFCNYSIAVDLTDLSQTGPELDNVPHWEPALSKISI